MANTWILVAHGSAGKILAVRKSGEEISLVKELSHPQTAQEGTAAYSDRPGRSSSGQGNARHAMNYPEDPTDHERQIFASEISTFLEKAFNEKQFDRLVLAASPSLLGKLREVLSDSVRKVVFHQLDKDYLSQDFPAAKLVEKIKKDLNLLHW